jgi:hypothetical protein
MGTPPVWVDATTETLAALYLVMMGVNSVSSMAFTSKGITSKPAVLRLTTKASPHPRP